MPHTYIDTAADLPLFAMARARRHDPITSHEAAADVVEFDTIHHRRILDALALGPAGATEIAERAGMGRDQVGKRLSELERDGRVVIDGKVRNTKGRNESRYRRAAINTPGTTSVAGTLGG